METLIKKYDIAVPRYTSYPTVPYWENDSFSVEKWKNALKTNFEKNSAISLYLHLPFCEKLCTYCACNKRITLNHLVEMPYINALLTEWNLYLEIFGKKPTIKEVHLGGGTPTFFSAANLNLLLSNLFDKAHVANDAEMSVEVHPIYTTFEQLATLYGLGFKRLSVGIQDFDEKVQTAINRPQSFEQTKEVFDWARQLGYESINADLVYGLPFQKIESVQNTISQMLVLRPERVAFYAYAHVPWKSKAQRHYTEADLPEGDQKRALYEAGRKMLNEAGYLDIGMDHFALPNDSLYQAFLNKKLHRNFMGYTTQNTPTLLGLGASSISDAWTGFSQNLKTVEQYQESLQNGILPIEKGHILDSEDLFVRQQILNLMCQGQTTWNGEFEHITQKATERLKELEKDGLVILKDKNLQVSELGKVFLRNIAFQFDQRFWTKQKEGQTFSRAI